MPVESCQKDKKPGYRWGTHGKCYTFNPKSKPSRKRAKENAALQGRAIAWRKYGGGVMETITVKKIFAQVSPDDLRGFIAIAKARGYLEQVRREILIRLDDWRIDEEIGRRVLEDAVSAWLEKATHWRLSEKVPDEAVLEQLRSFIRGIFIGRGIGEAYRIDPFFERSVSVKQIDYKERIKEWLIPSGVFEGLWRMTDSDHAEEICNVMPEALASDYEQLVRATGKDMINEQELNEILMGPLKDLAWDFAIKHLGGIYRGI